MAEDEITAPKLKENPGSFVVKKATEILWRTFAPTILSSPEIRDPALKQVNDVVKAAETFAAGLFVGGKTDAAIFVFVAEKSVSALVQFLDAGRAKARK